MYVLYYSDIKMLHSMIFIFALYLHVGLINDSASSQFSSQVKGNRVYNEIRH